MAVSFWSLIKSRYIGVLVLFGRFFLKSAKRKLDHILPHPIRIILEILSLEMSVEFRLYCFEASFREKIGHHV